ncbi:hypothetical protein EV356DRAFT_571450 [Viridothelium virens]|uniref:Uncharacterized protein n=1 Tax=Viridothelium virens TaxID=1048519 RepID=A0A6A6GTA8_VIRVR|nr:hypothetical protein EV356DRAFT_571450 [Viridothelium virens]
MAEGPFRRQQSTINTMHLRTLSDSECLTERRTGSDSGLILLRSQPVRGALHQPSLPKITKTRFSIGYNNYFGSIFWVMTSMRVAPVSTIRVSNGKVGESNKRSTSSLSCFAFSPVCAAGAPQSTELKSPKSLHQPARHLNAVLLSPAVPPHRADRADLLTNFHW